MAAIPPPLFYTGASVLGQTATFVGYGFTGTGLTGWKTLDGKKRGFQDVVDVNNSNFGNPASLFGATFDSPANNALPLEGCVAPGDSGGGVFVNDGSQYYLAGVISLVAATNGNANSSYANVSGCFFQNGNGTRISRFGTDGAVFVVGFAGSWTLCGYSPF